MARKIISVALAISMIATAFIAFGAVGQPTLEGGIVATDSGGDSETIFFTYERVYYTLNFQVDDVPTAASFTVRLTDFGGNVHDWETVTTDTGGTDGTYESWTDGTWLDFNFGAGDDKYILEAELQATGQLLFSKEIQGMTQKLEIQPTDRSIFTPDESVTISLDVDYDSLINVTIQPANVTWINQSLTNFHWDKVWDLSGVDVGTHDIWVNRSTDDVNLLQTTIDIGYFDLELTVERATYLPGETATFFWAAKSIPDLENLNATLNYSLDYLDFNGDKKWINGTATGSPFSVTIPAVASINRPGRDIILTGNATYNDLNSEETIGADLTTLNLVMDTDKNTYQPGEDIIVDVTVTTAAYSLPIEGATADVVIDRIGVPEGLNLSGLMTGPDGKARGIIQIPATIEEDTYRVTVTASKLAYSDKESKNIDIQNSWVLDVFTDKASYLGGEDIQVTVQTFKNGDSTTVDRLEYWLRVGTLDILPKTITDAMTFTITAPENTDSSARVYVDAFLDNSSIELNGWSADFEISQIIMTLSASKMRYDPGDTITFEVLVLGDAGNATITYTISDADGAPVDSGTITLGNDGTDTFTLKVDKDNPSTSYKVVVVLNNGEGLILDEERTVTIIETDYLLTVWFKTSPKYYSTMAYVPGQKIVIGFEVIPQRDEVPDLQVVSATVWFNWWTTQGESRTFSDMKGELSMVIPENTGNGFNYIVVEVADVGISQHMIMINTDGSGWDSNMAGLKVIDWMLLILVILVLLMLVAMMMRGGARASALGAKEEKPPKEKKVKDDYQPKAKVDCPSCGNSIEVASSKRPIEVMCPKCGTSQMVQ